MCKLFVSFFATYRSRPLPIHPVEDRPTGPKEAKRWKIIIGKLNDAIQYTICRLFSIFVVLTIFVLRVHSLVLMQANTRTYLAVMIFLHG